MTLRPEKFMFLLAVVVVAATMLSYYVFPTDAQIYGALVDTDNAALQLSFIPYVAVLLVFGYFATHPNRLTGAFSGLGFPLILLLVAIALALASSTYSVVPVLSLRRALSNGLTTFSLVLVLSAIRDASALMTMVRLSLIAVLALCYFGLVFIPNAAIHNVAGVLLNADLHGSWKGAFIHKNVAGGIIMYALIAFAFRFLYRRSATSAVVVIASAVFMYFSESMTALTSILMAIGITWIAANIKGRLAFAVIVASVICCVLAMPFVVLYYLYPTYGVSFDGRAPIWNANILTIGDQWLLGLGYAAVYSGEVNIGVYDNFGYISRVGSHAHNGFLELAGQLGLVAVAIVVAFIATGLQRAFDLVRRGGQERQLGLTLICMLFAGLIRSIAEPDWFSTRAHWYVTVVLVLVASKAAHAGKRRATANGAAARSPLHADPAT